MRREQIAARINEVYAARLANDAEGCVACFAENGTFKMASFDDRGQFALPSIAKEGLAPLLKVLTDTWTWTEREPIAVVIDDLTAAVRYRLKTRHEPTGTDVETQIMDHIRFNNDLEIVEMVEFLDTAMLERKAVESDRPV
ncbi:MAG: nuclear transport factor 2 family protein [Pseudomonadota bacterium]